MQANPLQASPPLSARFEKFTLEAGGFQALYAETLMTREEFLQMFPEGNNYYYKVGPLTHESSCVLLSTHQSSFLLL